MPDKPRDPLDEPDDLLAEDEPTESEDKPEPAPSLIDDPPEEPPFVWEGDAEEPVPSDIEVIEEEPGEPLEDGDEPEGDDLYWAEIDEAAEEEPGWHTPEDEPVGEVDWPVEEEADTVAEEDWAELEEDPRRMVPSGSVRVGYRVRASLPELGLDDVAAVLDTGRADSVLTGMSGEPLSTTVALGGVTFTARLLREEGPLGLRLGRDVLAGRFVVDSALDSAAE